MKTISRRDFGKLTLGALGGAALMPLDPLWSNRLTPTVFGGVAIGVQSYSFHDRPLEKALDAMVSLGISNLELWDGHLHSRKAGEQEFKNWAKKFQDAGVTIVAYTVSAGDNWTDEQILHAFHCARLLGTDVVTSSATKQLVPRMDKISQQLDMRIGVHNHWHRPANPQVFESPQDYEEMLKSSSERVGINLDVGHFYAAGYDPVRFMDQHFDRLVHVHLKDGDKDSQHTDRPFGQGATPLVAAVRLLKQRKFKYAANIEWEVKDMHPVAGVAGARDYLKSVLA